MGTLGVQRRPSWTGPNLKLKLEAGNRRVDTLRRPDLVRDPQTSVVTLRLGATALDRQGLPKHHPVPKDGDRFP